MNDINIQKRNNLIGVLTLIMVGIVLIIFCFGAYFAMSLMKQGKWWNICMDSGGEIFVYGLDQSEQLCDYNGTIMNMENNRIWTYPYSPQDN